MIIALTGTPGTGKTSVSKILQKKGFELIDLGKTAIEKNFLIGVDKVRNSQIVDIEKFNKFIKKTYSNLEILIIEGHLSHLLKDVDKVIILRCHPTKLKNNLIKKKWKKEKIIENIQAEILDIILCETVEIHKEDNVFEIDVTNKSIEIVANCILELINNKFKNTKKYKIGKIDWSDEILKDSNLEL